jgi:hypothetical protein
MDTFTKFHGKASDTYLDMIRAWVREGVGALSAEEVRKYQQLPSAESQLARAGEALLASKPRPRRNSRVLRNARAHS